MTASASLDFSPENFQQMAGLVCYYNTANFHYLHVTANDNGERCLQIITHDNHKHIEAFDIPILLPVTGTVYLQAELNGADLQFYYALMKDNWIKAGPLLNAGILSDDYIRESGSRYQAAFTGAFVGICCQDLSGNKKKAWFDWFNYKEDEYHFISDIKME
jgi:xylan 1,4-beta-xylosidase